MNFEGLKRLDALHGVAQRIPSLTRFLRAVSSALYRIMEVVLGKAHPHTRVISEARELGPTHVTARREGDTVLFFTLRGWFAHATTEALLAAALQERGLDTVFVLCGGGPTQCDFKPASDPHVTPGLCRRCHGFGKRLLRAAGQRVLTLDEVVTGTERPSLAFFNEMSRSSLLGFEFDGWPVGDWVQASVQRSLLRGDIRDTKGDLATLRGFVHAACTWVRACTRLLDTVDPHLVVLTNGQFHAERIMLELARARGLDVVVYERGMEVDTTVWRRNSPVIPHSVDESIDAARPLTRAEDREIHDLLKRRAGGKVGYQKLWPTIQKDQREICSRLGVDLDRPVITMFTNILWDSAVFRCDVGFDGMMDWVLTSVRLFSELGEAQLVVRVHPSEVRLTMSESRDRVMDHLAEQFSELPSNVVIVPPDDPASSYALLDISDAVLVYTSTIGLEAACRGLHVLVCGDCHYRGKGFTVDVAGHDQYRDQVVRVLRDTRANHRDAAVATAATRYAHAFFIRHQLQFPWFHDGHRGDRYLNVSDRRQLAPGYDPDLDALIGWMLEGGRLPTRGRS